MGVRRRARCLLAGMAIFVISPSAMAAEPSIEGAQNLFGEIVGLSKGQVGYSIGSFPNKNDNRPSPDYGELFAYWTVDRVEIVGKCVTRFHLVPGSVQVSNDVNNIKVNALPHLDLDWSKVSAVDSSTYFMGDNLPGWQISLVHGGKKTWLAFDVSKKNLERVIRAATFLKERCVASTDTGF